MRSIILAINHTDPSTRLALLATELGILVVPLLLGWYAYLCRRRISRFFAISEFDEPTLYAINERLFTLNTSNVTASSLSFSARRLANISFRGQRISVIYGYVSAYSNHSMRLFTIADAEQAQWMNANPDVFKSARLGSPFSVFWVELAPLEKELRRIPSVGH